MMSVLFNGKFYGFIELKKALEDLPNQVVGKPFSICEAGELYVEFLESALARPDDVEVIERNVVSLMARRLFDYLAGRSGRIYWRIPFEYEIAHHSEVVRYDENGPDTDIFTDRRCVLDNNWRRVACYARLYRATHYVPEEKA